MKTTTLKGAGDMRLAADVAGDPTAPAVVLLHGGGQTRHAWSRAFRELVKAGYHVVSYDARGHGDSGWAEDGDYSTDALVADLHAVVSALPAAPALVGASMGGITSLTAIGESQTPLASALVLVDVAPSIERSGVEHIRAFMTANIDGFATLSEAADAVAAYNPARPRPKDPSGLMKNLRTGDDGRLYWHWDPRIISTSQEEHVAYLEAYEARMSAAAQRVKVPALLVRGSQSDVVSPAGARQFRKLIPHAQVIDISGAGHMVAGDRNDAFNDAVLGFLAEAHPPRQ
jgi:pimeloyl-ACP methyl ester carboxylesterase